MKKHTLVLSVLFCLFSTSNAQNYEIYTQNIHSAWNNKIQEGSFIIVPENGQKFIEATLFLTAGEPDADACQKLKNKLSETYLKLSNQLNSDLFIKDDFILPDEIKNMIANNFVFVDLSDYVLTDGINSYPLVWVTKPLSEYMTVYLNEGHVIKVVKSEFDKQNSVAMNRKVWLGNFRCHGIYFGLLQHYVRVGMELIFVVPASTDTRQLKLVKKSI